LGRKLLIGGSAGVLSLGLIGIPAASFADDDGGATAQPTVTMTAGSFTVTLPGVGTLSFSVAPGTETLNNLTVTPADPSITAGMPVLTDEGVQVRFTTPTGIETVEVEVEGDGPVPVVKAEAEGPEDGAEAANAPGRDDGDNENNQGDNENEHGDEQGAAPGTVTTTTDGRDGSGMGDDGSRDGPDQGTTTTTTPPMTSTTPTTVTSGDGGSDGDGGSNGTSGDHGGDGGGSGSDG
jgi:hypothetical protein